MNQRAPTEIDNTIGQKIRVARKLAKMSQSELGVALGVTYQQVQKYENATDRIAASRLAIAASALEQPISFFYADELGGSAEVDNDTLAVRALMPELSPALRKSVLEIVKSLKVAQETDTSEAS